MTTPQRRAEAAEVEAAFQAALAQMGLNAATRALSLWQDVPVSASAGVRASWLRRAVGLVVSRRRPARELSIAYYRLVRALHTGATIPHPLEREENAPTLDRLRQEFEDALEAVGAPPLPRQRSGGTTPPALERPAETPPSPPDEAPEDDPLPNPDDDADDEADRLLLEEIDGLREEAEELERQAEREAEAVLKALGPDAEDRKEREAQAKSRGIYKELAEEADRRRQEAHDTAGSRTAATAARAVQNGARGTVWNIAQRDKRVVAYARVSQSGTPCGWCAMLISRGAVYKTKRAARGRNDYDDGDLYHDNCNCIAVPIFSAEQYTSDAKFDLNRQYKQEWPRVTRGLRGKAAVSAWRKHIRKQQKVAPAATAAPTNVQEA